MRRYAALLLPMILVACMLLPSCGCGEKEREASPFLESERRLEGMYEECRTIEITDPLGERPEILTDELKEMETVDVETVLVRSNGMEKPGVWTGTPLSGVLESHGVQGEFLEIRMEAWDGYVAKIPYEMA